MARKMEYGVFGIPRPDKVFYLSVPMNVILKNSSKNVIRISWHMPERRKNIVEGKFLISIIPGCLLFGSQKEKRNDKDDCVKGGTLEYPGKAYMTGFMRIKETHIQMILSKKSS